MQQVSKILKPSVTTDPIDLSALEVTKDDCFGNIWDNVAKPCVQCSMYDICMVLTLSKKKVKPKQVFFDELNWNAVPWVDLLNIITDDEITLNELKNTVKELSKCMDDITVHYKVQNWLIENKVTVKEGILCLES